MVHMVPINVPAGLVCLIKRVPAHCISQETDCFCIETIKAE